ncbi:hypothetical protein ACH3O9_11185 [Leeuwenhoekiella sp. A16]|uniref:hypothetical protein n=1 Tax=Leeuwenhoekiella sp. A16 TaxID=3141462 RepID=UPI003A80CB90
MANDLKELNDILFDTLRGIKDNSVDVKQANAVIGVSNALVNNAKVQLQAMKLSGGKTPPKFLSIEAGPQTTNFKNKHEAMTAYAQNIGERNVADAISKHGKKDFEKGLKEWLEETNQKY